jgi:hypothetical protein
LIQKSTEKKVEQKSEAKSEVVKKVAEVSKTPSLAVQVKKDDK